MFIDVCFPNNNEEMFIEIAKSLSTPRLCFVYDDKNKYKEIRDKEIETYSGLLVENHTNRKTSKQILFSNNISRNITNKNIILYYETKSKERRSFHAPLKSINQVIIKELKEKQICLGVSIHHMLNSRNNPEIIEQVSFIFKLCKKYDLDLFVASFARSPYQLRSMAQLESVLKTIGLNNKSVNSCFEKLHIYIRQILQNKI